MGSFSSVPPDQLERLEVLQQEIEDWFAEPEARSELRIDLDRCVPHVPNLLADELVWWARCMGYLAQRDGSSLVLKKASRCA
jgi:hypothetical protein